MAVILLTILRLLAKFHQHLLDVCADAEDNFPQVDLSNQDRWIFSFLWLPDFTVSEPMAIYGLNVYPFGVTPPFCVWFALRKALLGYGDRFLPRYS